MSQSLLRLATLLVSIAGYARFVTDNADAQLFIHDELVDGDLSSDFDAPDFFTLFATDEPGFLRINVSPSDRDFFTIVLRNDRRIDRLIVRDYQSALGNITFLGLQPGDTLSSPPSEDFADPIDYVIFGDWAIDEDILPLMLQNSAVLSAPLHEPSLAFWVNETDVSASFVLEIHSSARIVPEPNTGGLLLSALISLGFKRERHRRRQ